MVVSTAAAALVASVLGIVGLGVASPTSQEELRARDAIAKVAVFPEPLEVDLMGDTIGHGEGDQPADAGLPLLVVSRSGPQHEQPEATELLEPAEALLDATPPMDELSTALAMGGASIDGSASSETPPLRSLLQQLGRAGAAEGAWLQWPSRAARSGCCSIKAKGLLPAEGGAELLAGTHGKGADDRLVAGGR